MRTTRTSAKKSTKTSKLLCIFCYKPIVKSNNQSSPGHAGSVVVIDNDPQIPNIMNKLKTCDKFYHQLLNSHIQAGAKVKSKKQDWANEVQEEEDEENEEVSADTAVQQMASLWNPDKNGVCNDCFYAISTHTRLFEKMEKLQRRLRWQLDKLYKVMKYAAKIPTRVQEFEDNLTGHKDEKSVMEFRQRIYKTCRQKLKSDLVQNNISTFDTDTNNPGVSNESLQQSTSGEVIQPGGESRQKLSLESTSAVIIPQGAASVLTAHSPNAMPTIYKCSRCSNKFQSLESLTSHATTTHYQDIKKELVDGNQENEDDDNADQTAVIECTVDIIKGSKQEQMELNDHLETSQNCSSDHSSSSGMSCSDSDPVVHSNYPKLRRIIKSLRSHSDLSIKNVGHDDQANYFSETLDNCSPRKRRRAMVTTPANSSMKQSFNCSVICEKCGHCFTAVTMTQAKEQLVQHFENNGCHGCSIPSRKHICKFCNKPFQLLKSLNCHIMRKHARDVGKRFSCSHCKKWFSRENILISHFKTIHQNQVKLLQVQSVKDGESKNELKNTNGTPEENNLNGDISVWKIEPNLEAVLVSQ